MIPGIYHKTTKAKSRINVSDLSTRIRRQKNVYVIQLSGLGEPEINEEHCFFFAFEGEGNFCKYHLLNVFKK